jgi:WD40 repeat protein
VLHLGHSNGVVTLWTPNIPHPAVQIMAHLGPVVGLSVDPSSGGRYMATSGQDGAVKVWDCRNWKGTVREWTTRGGGAELEWSARGALSVAVGGSVNVSYCTLTFGGFHILRARCTQNRQYRPRIQLKPLHLFTSHTQYRIDRLLQ